MKHNQGIMQSRSDNVAHEDRFSRRAPSTISTTEILNSLKADEFVDESEGLAMALGMTGFPERGSGGYLS
jgi:hypothetical protein